MPSSNKIFSLNKNQINIFWSILFALEEQITIGFDLNAITLYRSDNTKKFYKNYMQIKKRIYESEKLKKYFIDVGREFALKNKIISAKSLFNKNFD